MATSSNGNGGTVVGMQPPHGTRGDTNPQQIQKLLDENAQIIKALVEAQNLKGKSMDIIQYQQILHRNLVYLAGLADPRVDIHQILPPPGSSNLLQSQRAPPPNQTISQNMTPPPSSTSPAPPISRPPNASITSMPSSQWVGGVTTPSMTASQQHMMGQYSMKGYAPSPWQQGAYSTASSGAPPTNAQQRLTNDTRRQQQQQMLRMHQEKLIRSQQARQLQGGGAMGGASSQPRGYMPMPGYMGGANQGAPPMGYAPPPSTSGGMPPTGGTQQSSQMDM